VLAPAELLRYSPGSLMLVVSPVDAEAERFAQRLIEARAALLSLAKVRGLLAGRVDEEEVEARAAQLLDAAVAKRLEANESVVISVEGLAPETREHYVRMAAAHKRPCHIVLVETPREQVEEDVRPTLNKLRKLLGAGDLGKEGFNTALRVMPNSMSEIKRIVFRPPPRDDD